MVQGSKVPFLSFPFTRRDAIRYGTISTMTGLGREREIELEIEIGRGNLIHWGSNRCNGIEWNRVGINGTRLKWIEKPIHPQDATDVRHSTISFQPCTVLVSSPCSRRSCQCPCQCHRHTPPLRSTSLLFSFPFFSPSSLSWSMPFSLAPRRDGVHTLDHTSPTAAPHSLALKQKVLHPLAASTD